MLAGYWQQTFELGPDPDGEGQLVATLVRRGEADPSATHAVLAVHGFTDYFFHTELADHFAGRGFAFYALDLHKCGRSWREGQTPHFTTDLARYDRELERALDVIGAGVGRCARLRALRRRAHRLAVAGPAAPSRPDRSASTSPAWCSTVPGWICRVRALLRTAPTGAAIARAVADAQDVRGASADRRGRLRLDAAPRLLRANSTTTSIGSRSADFLSRSAGSTRSGADTPNCTADSTSVCPT